MNEASTPIEEGAVTPSESASEPDAAPGSDAARGAGEAPAGPGAEGNGHAELSEGDVLEALKDVLDPELGVNIVDLGLVYDVTIEGDTVHITYTLTTMGCPIGPLIEAQMQQLLAGVPGVEHVDAEMVLRPPWSPEMMSEEAKAALGFF